MLNDLCVNAASFIEWQLFTFIEMTILHKKIVSRVFFKTMSLNKNVCLHHLYQVVKMRPRVNLVSSDNISWYSRYKLCEVIINKFISCFNL